MAQSELSKAANRVAFGVQEDEVGFQTGNTKGLGLIGGQTGKVRVTQADPRNKRKSPIFCFPVANASFSHSATLHSL